MTPVSCRDSRGRRCRAASTSIPVQRMRSHYCEGCLRMRGRSHYTSLLADFCRRLRTRYDVPTDKQLFRWRSENEPRSSKSYRRRATTVRPSPLDCMVITESPEYVKVSVLGYTLRSVESLTRCETRRDAEPYQKSYRNSATTYLRRLWSAERPRRQPDFYKELARDDRPSREQMVQDERSGVSPEYSSEFWGSVYSADGDLVR